MFSWQNVFTAYQQVWFVRLSLNPTPQTIVKISCWTPVELSHQFHAGSPPWWRMLACSGPWSLTTKSIPCSAITANRVSSRDTPPLYVAGQMANGTPPKSPAQAVSTHLWGTSVHNPEAVQPVVDFTFNTLVFHSWNLPQVIYSTAP